MRVFLISHSARIGGAELALAESARAFCELGHDVHVVLPQAGPLVDRICQVAAIHIHHYNPWAGRSVPRLVAARWLAYNVRVAVPTLIQLLRRHDADAVISNTITEMTGGLAALLAGRPHAWYAHEYGVPLHDVHFVLGERTTRILMRQLSSELLVPSEALRDYFAPRFRGRPVRVVRQEVETDLRLVPDLRRQPLRLVMIGRVSPGKGQSEAIEALAVVLRRGIDAQLAIVGDGDEGFCRRLRDHSARLGVDAHVEWIPPMERPTEVMARSSVVVSCSRLEGLGRILIEGMKAGLPVVGAASGATPDLIRHRDNGLLYQPGDHKELARQLIAIHDAPDTAAAIALRGREWATARFNRENLAADLSGALSSLCA